MSLSHPTEKSKSLLLRWSKYLGNILLTSLIMGTIASIVAAIIFVKWLESPLKSLTIPVFITAQDNQGGQFALGVSRAIDWAQKFKLDEVDGRQVRPFFINEDLVGCKPGDSDCSEERNTQDLVSGIRDLKGDVPIVVGPLTSTHAALLVPSITKQLGIPMILGIPTNTELSAAFNGKVWRLSPTDDLQAEAVAKTLEELVPHGERSVIVVDSDGQNGGYSKPLAKTVAEKAAGSNHLPTKPVSLEIGSSRLGEFQQAFLTANPAVVIYVGMPEQAKRLLSMMADKKMDAKLIFTDGCIDPEFIQFVVALSKQRPKSQFFMTFQAPPASQSKGIRSYIWFTQSMGGRVTGVVDQDCGTVSAATSYEVFGFDAYMMALNLLKDTSRTGKVNRENVSRTMARTHEPKWPFLLMAPYNFDEKGNNKNLRFHLYEIGRDGCVRHSGHEPDSGGALCPNDSTGI